MGTKSRPSRKDAGRELENVCAYCLFFQSHRAGRRRLCGNCTYHKQWIENASLTTCSDMSSRPLTEKGIYELAANNGNGWLYTRRQERIRTRLFLVVAGCRGRGKCGGEKE